MKNKLYIKGVLLHSAFAACLSACGLIGLVAFFFPLFVRQRVEWSEKIGDKANFFWQRPAERKIWTRRFEGSFLVRYRVPNLDKPGFLKTLPDSLTNSKGERGLFLEARRNRS